MGELEVGKINDQEFEGGHLQKFWGHFKFIPYSFNTFFSILYLFCYFLSYDGASESEITPCNKIDKPLVVYRFMGNVMTSITTLRT